GAHPVSRGGHAVEGRRNLATGHVEVTRARGPRPDRNRDVECKRQAHQGESPLLHAHESPRSRSSTSKRRSRRFMSLTYTTISATKHRIEPCCANQKPSLNPAIWMRSSTSTNKMPAPYDTRNQIPSKASKSLRLLFQ